MDKASSVHLYPNEMEITGDPIEIKTGSTHWQTSYKTKITKFQHTQGDPHFACDVYTVDNSYNECVQNNVLELFEKELGCHPPLLAKNNLKMCNKKFNITNKTRLARVNKLFRHVFDHNGKYECRPPCTSFVYKTKFLHKAQRPRNRIYVQITFENSVEVVRSTFSVDEQTFLTRLGGSVSSGRTLLWIFLTLVGIFEVKRVRYLFHIFLFICK